MVEPVSPATHPRPHLALWAAIAVAWLILGNNSDNVPTGNTVFWVVACGLVAGAAVGVAHRASRHSLLVYLVAALIVGAVRSVAYVVNGSGGPAAVWLIVSLTNAAILLRYWGDPNGGG